MAFATSARFGGQSPINSKPHKTESTSNELITLADHNIKTAKLKLQDTRTPSQDLQKIKTSLTVLHQSIADEITNRQKTTGMVRNTDNHLSRMHKCASVGDLKTKQKTLRTLLDNPRLKDLKSVDSPAKSAIKKEQKSLLSPVKKAESSGGKVLSRTPSQSSVTSIETENTGYHSDSSLSSGASTPVKVYRNGAEEARQFRIRALLSQLPVTTSPSPVITERVQSQRKSPSVSTSPEGSSPSEFGSPGKSASSSTSSSPVYFSTTTTGTSRTFLPVFLKELGNKEGLGKVLVLGNIPVGQRDLSPAISRSASPKHDLQQQRTLQISSQKQESFLAPKLEEGALPKQVDVSTAHSSIEIPIVIEPLLKQAPTSANTTRTNEQDSCFDCCLNAVGSVIKSQVAVVESVLSYTATPLVNSFTSLASTTFSFF